MERRVDVIQAPDRRKPSTSKTIFLAGPTSDTGEPDWRQTLTDALAGHSVTVFNPNRPDWDSTWREDSADARWVEQVQWELDMQDAADIVVVLFHRATLAPISLLELGLCARSGRAIVCALDGYGKRGNVEFVCKRHGLGFVTTEEALRKAVMEKLE